LKERIGTPYYMAPEVIAGSYTEKCDVWSCGVILFLLLSGETPFDGATDAEILSNVSKGLYLISGPVWSKISKEAIDLVQKLLAYSPAKRTSAVEALNHPWISNNTERFQLSEMVNSGALLNLKQFNAGLKIQQATVTFLTTHLISKKEQQELKRIFDALDKNGDGKLSREELLAGYSEMMSSDAAEEEVTKIMNNVD